MGQLVNEDLVKGITCNECDHKFKSSAENKNIRCPECKSNKSLSVLSR